MPSKAPLIIWLLLYKTTLFVVFERCRKWEGLLFSYGLHTSCRGGGGGRCCHRCCHPSLGKVVKEWHGAKRQRTAWFSQARLVLKEEGPPSVGSAPSGTPGAGTAWQFLCQFPFKLKINYAWLIRRVQESLPSLDFGVRLVVEVGSFRGTALSILHYFIYFFFKERPAPHFSFLSWDQTRLVSTLLS